MTSVAGHLVGHEFISQYRGWQSCQPDALFEAPIEKIIAEVRAVELFCAKWVEGVSDKDYRTKNQSQQTSKDKLDPLKHCLYGRTAIEKASISGLKSVISRRRRIVA